MKVVVSYKEYECDGYPPCNIGIDSEYDSGTLEFSYCLECGQIQDKWPKSDPDFSEYEGCYKEEELRRIFSE